MVKTMEDAFPYVREHLALRNLCPGEKVMKRITRHMLIETVINCQSEDDAAEKSINYVLEKECFK